MTALRFAIAVLGAVVGICIEIVLTTVGLAALIAVPLLLVGCPVPPVCSPAETRCFADAERVEVCDSNGQWTLVTDCNVVGQQSGGRWVCQEETEGGEAVHACLPLGAP